MYERLSKQCPAVWLLGTGHLSRKHIWFKIINVFIVIYVTLFDKVIILSLLLAGKNL